MAFLRLLTLSLLAVLALGPGSGGARAQGAQLAKSDALEPISEPVTETVMVGSGGNRGFAFISPGHPIRVPGR
jgi:hypothetical protein